MNGSKFLQGLYVPEIGHCRFPSSERWCEFSARLLSQRPQVRAAALPITVRSPVGRKPVRDDRSWPAITLHRAYVDAPRSARKFEQLVTCGQVLSYVRPLKCGMHAPRAHMVFVDRIQIVSAVCLTALRAMLVFPTCLSDLLPLCCLSSQPHQPGLSAHHALKSVSARARRSNARQFLFQAAIPHQRQPLLAPGRVPS